MEFFNENLTKSTILRDGNLVHSIRIAVFNKVYRCMVCQTKLWLTGPCHLQETSHITAISIMLYIKYVFQKLWLHQHGTICTHVVFCRLTGCHTMRRTTNIEVLPTDVTLMLLGCIVCILIIKDMVFATKGIEQHITNI